MTEKQKNIQIQVKSTYLPDRLPADINKYAFAYQVRITNNGSGSVRLLNRYWLITDGNNEKTEVAGEGVVGEQPLLGTGESFEYTSGAVIDTPVGTMQGHYEFEDENQTLFKVPIPMFRLAVAHLVN